MLAVAGVGDSSTVGWKLTEIGLGGVCRVGMSGVGRHSGLRREGRMGDWGRIIEEVMGIGGWGLEFMWEGISYKWWQNRAGYVWVSCKTLTAIRFHQDHLCLC
jgi:hypothetical protein